MTQREAGAIVFDQADYCYDNMSEKNRNLFRNITEFRKFYADAQRYNCVTDELLSQAIFLKEEEINELRKLRNKT